MPVQNTLALGDGRENMYYEYVKGHKENMNDQQGT